jgi:hypothetical protein
MKHHIVQEETHIPLQSALRRLPKLADIQEVSSLIGKRVRVQDFYYGVVTRLNDSPYGAFPGSTYPVMVRLDTDFHGHPHKEHAFKLSDIVIDE